MTLNQVISKADIDAGLLTPSRRPTPTATATTVSILSVNDGTADSLTYTMTVDVTAERCADDS